MSDVWEYTDNPDDPCSVGIQWRCVHCKQGFCDDDCPGAYMVEMEPYHPDGSTIPRVFRGIHPSCQKMIDDYYEDVRRDPS